MGLCSLTRHAAARPLTHRFAGSSPSSCPTSPLVAIPDDDPIMSAKVGFDLKDVQYTRAAGGRRGFPQLEGVKLNDHWAIIYSKFDIGCALERHTGIDCKGYTHASAVKIAGNIVIYAMLP